MKKRILAITLAAIMTLSFTACGDLDLEGNWEMAEEIDDMLSQAAYITEDTITVIWYAKGEEDDEDDDEDDDDEDGEEEGMLYWVGSYEAPTESTDSYSWDSVNDTDQTDSALLASSEETKTFTYEDGVLSYEVTFAGETYTYELVESTYDYASVELNDDTTEFYETLVLALLLNDVYEEEETTEEIEEETAEEVGVGVEAEEEEDDTVESFDFTSTTVIDTDEVSISIDDFDFASSYYDACEMGVTYTNKNANVDYEFTVESITVNGVNADVYSSETVTAGNKAMTDVGFSLYDSDEDPITQYTDIAITFSVSEDAYFADDILYETVHVYPYGKENATTYTRESQDADVVIYEDDNVSVTLVGMGHDDDTWLGSYDLELYLVNKTDDEVRFSVDDATVNNIMISDKFSETVAPNSSGVYTYDFDDDHLEDIGITDPENEIETISMPFHIYNNSEDYATDYVEDTFNLTFNR